MGRELLRVLRVVAGFAGWLFLAHVPFVLLGMPILMGYLFTVTEGGAFICRKAEWYLFAALLGRDVRRPLAPYLRTRLCLDYKLGLMGSAFEPRRR
jgi:hypothetical protein